MSPEQRRDAGFRARIALEDGALKEAFEACEADIHAAWAAARWPRTRERLHAELRALNRVRSKLASTAGQAPRN
jgi:hypothetical protein